MSVRNRVEVMHGVNLDQLGRRPAPVYGDMTYEMRYTMYKEYNGVMFPGLIHVHQGDPRINPGENYFQVYTKDVKPNLIVNKLPVPEAVRAGIVAMVRASTAGEGRGPR